MKIHIKGGRLIDPKSGVDAKKDVYIAAGKIVAVGSPPNGFTANRVIDAAGLVVCPGLVDLAALRGPRGKDDRKAHADYRATGAATAASTSMRTALRARSTSGSAFTATLPHW